MGMSFSGTFIVLKSKLISIKKVVDQDFLLHNLFK